MNRKAKNIIFWTIAGFLIFIFVTGLVFGCIKTIWGAGTGVYKSTSEFIKSLGFNRSDFFNWSVYLCIASGIVLSIMFYKKFNTRIN